MEPEVFTDTNDSEYAGYRAWEARCKELGLDGPHRMASMVEWQFLGPNGTAAIYNAAKGRGHIFWRPADSASAERSETK